MKNTVYTRNDQQKETITPQMRALIRRAVNAALDYESFPVPAEVSVTFVDNEQIRQLNRDYRDKDAATDVLSFPLYEKEELQALEQGETAELGDIILSVERAREQADTYGHSLDRELAFLSVHSVLHLLGYDHELSDEDDADMRRRQSEVLEKMGLKV